MKKTIKDCEQTIRECKTKLEKQVHLQSISYDPKREKEIGYLQYLIKNNTDLMNLLNNTNTGHTHDN